jgi:hypothetical protein
LQTSDALGAAAAQLGPDAQAAVVELNKHGGLSHGKVTRCLERRETRFQVRVRLSWAGLATRRASTKGFELLPNLSLLSQAYLARSPFLRRDAVAVVRTAGSP